MNLYVAGPWVKKAEVAEVVEGLRANGWHVVSTWTEQDDTSDPDTLERLAYRDFDELMRSDALIMLYPDIRSGGGKETELGASLALDNPVVLVGNIGANIFHRHPIVTVVPTVEAAERYLRATDVRNQLG